MNQKRSDLLFGFVTMVAVVLSIVAYFKNKQPSSQLAIKQNLQIVAMVRESDCVECVGKVVCYWENIATDFNAQRIETPLVFGKESEGFQTEELGFLCQIPTALKVLPYQEIKGASLMPMATPSVMVTDGKQILYLEPIFLPTEMAEVHHRIATAISLYLPKASE